MKWTRRRKFLAGVSSLGAAGASGLLFTGWNGKNWKSSSGDHSPIIEGPTISLEQVAKGFTQPLALENPVDNYYYIADRFGSIYLYSDGELGEEPILNIEEKLHIEYGSQGLLGIEFHPDFETNQKFYVRYSSPRKKGTPEGYSHTAVVSEFRTTEDYQNVVSDSERPILEIPEPGRMHNAGAMEFGPDGYFYVTLGDGGGDGHDGSGPLNRGANSHAGDWYWLNVGGNGQDVKTNLLGSVLRIDVDHRDGELPYAIPDSNPLTESQGLDEHYAWGFRNPYSMTFDGDDLYVTDAGTKVFEEVNRVKKGGNYGWNIKEGTGCHNNFPALRAFSKVGIEVRTLPACPNATPSGEPLRDPIITYPGKMGAAIIGGEMYHNPTVSKLKGKYVFGDLAGKLFAASPSSSNDFWTVEELFVASSDQSEANKRIGGSPLSIEKGSSGELFVLMAGQPGSVHRIRSSQ